MSLRLSARIILLCWWDHLGDIYLAWIGKPRPPGTLLIDLDRQTASIIR